MATPPDPRSMEHPGATPPVVLAIAGSDPSGGAGIQGDLKTLAAFGVYGAALPTLLTAQTTRGVVGVHHPPPEFVAESLAALLGDLSPRVIKMGALGPPPMVEALGRVLGEHRGIPRVVDPVLLASATPPDPTNRASASPGAGSVLGSPEALRTHILADATLWTPNVPEAALFLGTPIDRVLADLDGAARGLLGIAGHAVLLKGGHGDEDRCVDILVHGPGGRHLRRFDRPRLQARNDHGTGCALASGIAALLALGAELPEAVRGAGNWLARALNASDPWRIGAGPGPPDHRVTPEHLAHPLGERPGEATAPGLPPRTPETTQP